MAQLHGSKKESTLGNKIRVFHFQRINGEESSGYRQKEKSTWIKSLKSFITQYIYEIKTHSTMGSWPFFQVHKNFKDLGVYIDCPSSLVLCN